MMPSAGNIVGVSKGRKGAKEVKDRLTIGMFCNAIGDDFFQPCFIGKSKRLRSFGKHWTTEKHLKAHYYNTDAAWMTTSIWWDINMQFNM